MGLIQDTASFVKENWKILMLFGTVLAVFLGLLYLVMALIALLITWYGSILVMFVVFFFVSRKIAKVMVFPGHGSFFKRSVEFAQCKKMCSQVIGQVLEQRYSLDVMTYTLIDFERITDLIDVNYNTGEMIKSIEYTLSRQRELGTITDDQEGLQDKIEILKGSFKSINIFIGDRRMNLWDLGEFHDSRDELFLNKQFKFESIDIVKRCVRTGTDFGGSFQELMPFSDDGDPAPIPLITKGRAFLSNTTFGGIDQLRVEMENM